MTNQKNHELWNVSPVIPGYEITEQLHQGIGTAVYRATQTSQQRAVVIKILWHEYPSFHDLMQFRNQYTIAKSLEIPGIVRPYNLEVYGNSYALVMEDFGGISLRNYLQLYPLSLSEILEVARDLSQILHDLHQNRVIHKDIKPANILIHPQTKQIKLIDFSIASLLPKETPEIQSPHVLEGTLAYLAPEQTGRMNRAIDYRVDFYALGITLYQLLSGKLPFETEDPLQLIHCHIAQVATPLEQINPDLPKVVSDIIAKLMAKNAEDRYQTALGLKFDLEQCLMQLRETGEIRDFEIASRDLSDRFLIPEKLYGRENEVQTLLKSFERVAQGASELMLVAGFSGIGKTVVINEVHKPITRQKGYFIKGKFDQFNRNIPLSAFVQAFRDLMEQLLAESDVQLAQWKSQIIQAVGENGQVLIEVIPELEQVIGPQPTAPELSGASAQNRFNLLFQKFIQVFTTVDHPLVIFLDDLQWSDSASLQLLKVLMESSGYLLVLGAYRDHEVSPVHPLMLTIEELKDLKKVNLTVNTITLSPLSLEQTNCLIADTLKCSRELAKSLTKLVERKTQGNPFFMTQFLKALHEEGYIIFDYHQGYWQCDIAEINALSFTDDVVEFMALQLQKLPVETQQILKLAACIGNQFDLSTLAIISQQSPPEAATALGQGLREGLIVPIAQSYEFGQSEAIDGMDEQTSKSLVYRFLHDRVQQAAYSLIPEDQKPETHWKIGKILRQTINQRGQEARIFEIVNQLNYGISLITDSAERESLAKLNLWAGQKAKLSSAYASAYIYFQQGCLLLKTDCWQSQYRLAMDLHIAAAEASCLETEYEVMKSIIDVILTHSQEIQDQVKIYELLIFYHHTHSQFREAVNLAVQILAQLKEPFPDSPDSQDFINALSNTIQLIENIGFENLHQLPPMQNPEKLAAMRILRSSCYPAYFAAPEILGLLICRLVDVTLNHGSSLLTPFAYGIFSVLLNGGVGNIALGAKFGELAIALEDRQNSLQYRALTYNCCYGLSRHFYKPVQECIEPLLRGYASFADNGDAESSSYCLINAYFCSILSGENLGQIQQKFEKYIHHVSTFKQEQVIAQLHIWMQVIYNLTEENQHPHQLRGEFFDLDGILPRLYEECNFNTINYAHIAQLLIAYTFDEYEQALAHAQTTEPLLGSSTGKFLISAHNFYYSLSLIALYPQVDATTQAQYLAKIQQQQAQLQGWVEHCAVNFEHKYLLVKAELARITQAVAEAIDLYDHAITRARVHGFVQDEALANELAAKFYLNWGKEKVAASYMQEAYYGYARWGARSKVVALEKSYPQLLKPILQTTNQSLTILETLTTIAAPVYSSDSTSQKSSSSNINQALDLATLLKISQTFASTIALDELLKSLTQTILENSGADGCALMLCENDQWQVRVMANPEQVLLQSTPLEDNSTVPIKLIHYVKNTLTTVVVDDLKTDLPVISDYLNLHQPKSILCLPILNQGSLTAILYLENHSTSGVFTSDRLVLLNFLCTQAAISLENARLYQKSQEYSQQLERSISELKTAQSQFHNLVDNVPGVVYQFLMDTDGSVSMPYISNDCYDLYEVNAEQVIADVQILMNRVHPEDAESHHQSIADSVQTLTPWRWEGRIITSSGKVKWIHGEARITKLEDGALSWDGLLVDISEQRAAEAIIQQKSQDLEKTLQELQNAQLQMVQNEKMASLGNLVAGVAHEINNPIGFLNGSINNGKDYVQDLLGHLALYQQHYPNPVTTIQDHAEDIDLEYLCEDLPKLLNSMQGATDRIKSISTSLRTFSRADTEYKVSANLHEGIDSTVLILKYRLKANAQRPAIHVIQDYGNLPLVECFPGQLNQVFMNILANAIDMFDEMAQERSFQELEANPQTITIATVVVENQVQISIRDNGQGINAEVKSKIFDHLFTTKSVGKGTGLGLAIARQIVVDKHGGSLEVESELEQGTEFLIRLPIHAE